jgi:mannose-6-phosphate isomerase-like protein (cupin superfamily)
MQAFELDQVTEQMSREGRAWMEFLRVPALSIGVYHLPAGRVDEQNPHTEDEVYYILRGVARFRTGDEERSVHAGTILFVERNVEHRFFDISEDLTVLVFFAPAEHSLRP